MLFMHNPKEIAMERIFKECMKKVPQVPSAIAVKRVAIAKKHLLKGSQFWIRDEKKWNLKGNDHYVSIWREKTKKYTFETDLCCHPWAMV
jgi:hypothetical protein